MLKYLCKKITLQWFILFGLTAFSIYTIITKTHISEQTGSAFLFKSFSDLFAQNQFFGKGIIIIVLLVQIYLIQLYFRKNEYAAKKSLLPACFYLSILLLSKSLITISPFFFTLLFFIIIISTNYTGDAVTLKNNAFWVGMLIALATCFDVSGVVLLVLAIITLILNHFSIIKEICILLFGFFLVYLYFFSFHFFMNSYDEWLATLLQIKILGIFDEDMLSHTSTLIALLIFSFLYLYFIIRTRIINDSKIVVQRKRVITLNTRALLMIACLFLSNSTYPCVLGYLFIHISVYLSILAQEKNPLFVNEIITVATFIVLCL